MSEEKKVKKVNPYPITGTLEIPGQKVEIDILRITSVGIQAQLKAGIVFVGKYYQCQFSFPGHFAPLQAEVRVIKTTDRPLDPRQKVVERMVEIHFVNLSPAHRSSISTFLQATGGR